MKFQFLLLLLSIFKNDKHLSRQICSLFPFHIKRGCTNSIVITVTICAHLRVRGNKNSFHKHQNGEFFVLHIFWLPLKYLNEKDLKFYYSSQFFMNFHHIVTEYPGLWLWHTIPGWKVFRIFVFSALFFGIARFTGTLVLIIAIINFYCPLKIIRLTRIFRCLVN